jgi:hypothetical protein
MAAGSAFTLIVNDSEQDDILMRTAQLERLIEKIEIQSAKAEAQRAKEQGKKFDGNAFSESFVPSLVQISQYYTIPFISLFKPFVACAQDYIKHMSSGQNTFGSTVTFTLQQINMFVTDMVLHVKISSFQATSALDKVRWCAFPGHRLCEQTSFTVNGSAIDTYYTEDMIAHYDYLPKGRKDWWKRCVGQQIPYDGTLTSDPSIDEVSEVRRYVDGPQVFKRTQPELDLWIPSLMWFSDPGYALPNGIIAYGQTNVDVKFAELNDLVSYVNLGGGGTYSTPTIIQCELYVNNLGVVEDLADIFQKRIGTMMIRIHKHTKSVIQNSKGQIKLKDLRFPVEKMYFAFRPRVNLDNTQQWHKMCKLTETRVATPVLVTVVNPSAPPPTIQQVGGNYGVYYSESPTIDTLSLLANTNELFKEVNQGFFGNYLGLKTCSGELDAPESTGWYLINFNTRPTKSYTGAWEPPSGHINASRAREMVLMYSSSYISDANPVDFILSAQVINFLSIEDESATLRYTT